MKRSCTLAGLYILCITHFSLWSVVINVATQDDFGKLIQSEKPVLVKFFAQWCGACNLIKEPFENLINETDIKDIQLAQADIDDLPLIAREYNIEYVPQIMLFKNGAYIKTITIAGLDSFTKDVVTHINSSADAPVKPNNPRKNIFVVLINLAHNIISYISSLLNSVWHKITGIFYT